MKATASVNAIAIAVFGLFGSTIGQKVDGSDYNNPTAGPPASFFTAAATQPVSALETAAAQASQAAPDGTYPINTSGSPQDVTIYADWSGFSNGAAYVWVSNMNVDCDGLDYQCKGNPDGQPQTDFGALAAYEVPWIVVPNQFSTDNQNVLQGNNLAAVICNDQMFYGVFGDSDGDDPEQIGEASWLMATTCFPNEGLNGNNAHDSVDVTYIQFIGDDSVLPSSAIDNNYVTDFTTLRTMGDSLMNSLVSNLGLSRLISFRVFNVSPRPILSLMWIVAAALI